MTSNMTKASQKPKYLVEAKGPEIDNLTAQGLFSTRRNKYLLVNVIARRARDLNRGERTLVELLGPHTHTELAVAEVQADKLALVRKQKSKVLVNLIKNE